MGQECEKEFGCLILAAGESRRMGTQKLLLELEGKPILQHVVDLANSLEFKEIVVVLGGNHTQIQQKVRFGRARVVVNPNYREGLSTSLKLGLSSFQHQTQGYMVMLGDQPLIKKQTLRKLLCEHLARKPLMTIPVYQDKRGNPVILSPQLLGEIETIMGDVGAKTLVQRHPESTLWVQVDDPGVTLDVDTPQDYQALLSNKAQNEH